MWQWITVVLFIPFVALLEASTGNLDLLLKDICKDGGVVVGRKCILPLNADEFQLNAAGLSPMEFEKHHDFSAVQLLCQTHLENRYSQLLLGGRSADIPALEITDYINYDLAWTGDNILTPLHGAKLLEEAKNYLTKNPDGTLAYINSFESTGFGFLCEYTYRRFDELASWFEPTSTSTQKPTIPETELIGRDIVPNAAPLRRSYGWFFIKHHYQMDSRRFPVGYQYERAEGKVIPYSYYSHNRATIKSLCPKLSVLYEIFQTYGIGSRGKLWWNQYFSWQPSSPDLNNGAMMLVSKQKGYCGANKAMYYVLSKAPYGDTFYTTNETEYLWTVQNNTLYQGTKNGIAFYVWE
ncbi:hypothetical protein QR680_008132 [Steinernema hermaphroditum]|uniref:SCP domain-containing protein n=1 Tax=Steinernema hermaphroditum TaxID=289476 RepID=A0AA39IFI8_9BILA|nr:hypothetical protein QR680_008132 [Steinernema hermaphroditum]